MSNRLKQTWYGMKYRCYSPKLPPKTARNYRDKGITVCAEWRDDYKAFEEWALSHGYADHLVIDRIDPNGNYEPDNCRWITKSENSARVQHGTNKKERNHMQESKVDLSQDDVTAFLQHCGWPPGLRSLLVRYAELPEYIHVQINELIQDWWAEITQRGSSTTSHLLSAEALQVAAAYDRASEKQKEIVRLVLELFIPVATERDAFASAGTTESAAEQNAKYLWRRICEIDKPEISKKRLFDICKGKRGFETTDGMNPGLDILVKRGYIKIKKVSATQKSQKSQNTKKHGRPSWMIYVVNTEYEPQ